MWGKVNKKAAPERTDHQVIFTAAKCNTLLKRKKIMWQKLIGFSKEEKTLDIKKIYVNKQPKFKDS